MIRLLSAVLLLAVAAGPAAAADRDVLRFGLTAVVVRENVRLFDRMSRYLEARVGRPIEFVRARSYRDIMEMLHNGAVDFAWICGYPYVRRRNPEFVGLLAVPIFDGAPLYRSYIIVHRDSPIRSFGELRDRVFAYADPESNSGYVYPRYLLVKRGEDPERFFRETFFTYNHGETVQAVAEQVADGGAVDSYVWEYLRRTRPRLAERTRVVKRSDLFGFPPIVARIGVDEADRKNMAKALFEMADVDEGRGLLADLGLDGFGDYSPDLFREIRIMADRIGMEPVARSYEGLGAGDGG